VLDSYIQDGGACSIAMLSHPKKKKSKKKLKLKKTNLEIRKKLNRLEGGRRNQLRRLLGGIVAVSSLFGRA
jgi:hypothetical protein